ncbi:bifunctional arginine demethylase and lysyl-hydroxylase JMJD6 [Tribolium madens]|uniref:bifunctional arginine demethylase and lysyl-hydroxylase JMJD6 n=1 Tax=Tribolium madens TaxID=41895 RepID=UPI001CF74190|nr:bifunctional arginine demethylase and lysyl-hydroxylase JMJD6 [Tribolium madens]
MQKAEKRLQALTQKYSGFSKHDYSKLDVTNKIFKKPFPKTAFFLLVPLLLLTTQINFFDSSSCLIDMPSDSSKWFREPESCDICEGVTEVPKIKNISPSEFYSNFVTSAKPVVVTDGATTWPASQKFSFDFFKNLYANSDSNFCQFFPYKTEFTSLEEVLEMDPKRANLEPGQKPWYIGWSNCNDNAGKILREYYNTPYFLPNTSENIALNWIFMGGPGQGAHMHVDNVQYPSWQAQIKGRKLWRLAPPPECLYKCQEIQVIVESGEIIIVDTNRWYHQTFILPGEISITIGAEFD